MWVVRLSDKQLEVLRALLRSEEHLGPALQGALEALDFATIQRRFHDADDGWQEEAGRRLPMGKLGQVDEIADFVVFLLSDRSGVVTGSVIDWDQNVFVGLDG